MSSTTRAVRARTSSAIRVPVLEVGLVGLLAPVRPRHPRRRVDRAGVHAAAEPVVPRPHRRPELRGQHPGVGRRPAGARCRCRARPAACAILRADPPQRVGRPLAHHLEPGLVGRAGRRPARLAELGRDLGPQLVVADADRAVQPGRGQHLGADLLGERRAGRPARRAPSPRPEERLVPAEHLDHHRHAAPLQRRAACHHLRRGRVVRRPVDRQEHRVRALARAPPAAASRSRRRTPGPRTTPWRPRPRSVGSPRPPTTTGRPASSGRRSTSTAAMNWSRSTCSTHARGPVRRGHSLIAAAAAARRWTRAGPCPVSSSRSTTTDRSCASTTSAASSSVALDLPGRLRRPRAAPAARAIAIRSASSSSATTSAASARSSASSA